VAHGGSIAAASTTLGLAPATISEQVTLLQQRLGVTLLARRGRSLAVTPVGHVVLRYADEIVALGRDLVQATRSEQPGRPLRVRIGVADVLPKVTAMRLLAPAVQLGALWHTTIRTDRPEGLVADLGANHLDVLITDTPLPASARVRAYSHLLGDSGISLFAAPRLAARLAPGFPRSLDGAPLLAPREGASIRRSLDAWCHAHRIRPDVVADVDDMAMLQLRGHEAIGAFCAPDVVRAEIERTFNVQRVGVLRGARERFYAVTTERTLRHPAVIAVADAARQRLARVRAERRR
jgi:LysR family transcriptional regulator, transcriptional activator of nhaA